MKRFHSRFTTVQRLRKQQDTAAAAVAANAFAAAAQAQNAAEAAKRLLMQTYSDAQAAMSQPVSAYMLHATRNLAAVGTVELVNKRRLEKEADERAKQATEKRAAAFQQLQIVSEALDREFSQHRKVQLALDSIQITERFQQQNHTSNQKRPVPAGQIIDAETGVEQ